MNKKVTETANLNQESEIRLSSGVVLTAKTANPLVLLEAMTNHPRPKPPLVFMETMGRKIENSADPDYIEQVKAWEREQSNVMLDALILYGTALKERPKGVPGPNDDEWLQKYSLLHLETFPTVKDWRYLSWVKFVAVQDADDLKVIRDAVGTLSGVKAADVKTAETFPGSDEANR